MLRGVWRGKEDVCLSDVVWEEIDLQLHINIILI